METKTSMSKRIDRGIDRQTDIDRQASIDRRESLKEMERLVHIYRFAQNRGNRLLFDVVAPEGAQIVNGNVFVGVQGECVCLGTVRECINKYGGGVC